MTRWHGGDELEGWPLDEPVDSNVCEFASSWDQEVPRPPQRLVCEGDQ